MRSATNFIHQSLRLIGFDLVRYRRGGEVFPPDFGDEEIEIIRKVQPWTMTSPERIFALIQAVRHICRHAIPGAIVECGVWKGGSMAAAALTLLKLADDSRDLFLFDTFLGVTEPTETDIEFTGKHAKQVLAEEIGSQCSDAPLEGVRTILFGTGYPRPKIHFVPGRVEETIPTAAPEVISVLRLDTDWYESTRHELIHLFPRLSKGGIIIIDDYGHWKGARHACDEYFNEYSIPILLHRVDYTGRVGLKP